ncbi:membrane protein [Stenotrophomonas daejeonensis]|uniref:Membrane protein n=1 Tax=Stenotrophomonas daejeonensis TaxID=659018 RepID=A0A0R0E1W1_9GAMM|nr:MULTISPECIES: regulatory signaling modulator protein AmpE [Stenotrophomonas]KRG83667.1 membrane protein [Stenotrophomonas daejeonensis]MCG8275646.1 regulatory signaling modulator protein AmpE [Stenotrophomonas sp. NLF4-10]
MFTTLVAVIAALVLGHLAPAVMAAMRDWHWFGRWLAWLQAQGGWARGRFGLLPALVPLLLPVALLQWLLDERLYGLPSLLYGIVVLVLCWGPRDLDRDVEAVIDADDAGSRAQATAHLRAAGGSMREDAASLVDAVMFNALRRWFAPLFWFLLLGPFGVAAYRLLAQAVQGPQAARLSGASHEGGSRALAVLEWPVAQLMALSMALVGNFDTVFSAWRRAAGNRWALELDFLGEAARAGVGMELGEEAEEAREAGLVPIDERFPELRDAMSVVWRMLLLWMAVLALMIIAGWVG